ncbi:MAG: tol-pal system YbgF family protein [Saprospiraceae bacterium]
MKKISDYLDNKLSPDAAEELTKRIVNAQIDQSKKANWQQKLANQHNITRTPKKNNLRIALFQWRNVAAIFLVVAMSIVFYFSQPVRAESQAMAYLMEQKYESKNNVTRGDEQAATSELYNKAYLAYKNSDYESASTSFLALLQKDPNYSNAHYYLGLSQLYLDDYSQAIASLQKVKVLSTTDQAVQDEANWFLGLAYTLSGQKELARQTFKEIVATKAWNADEAAKILSNL